MTSLDFLFTIGPCHPDDVWKNIQHGIETLIDEAVPEIRTLMGDGQVSYRIKSTIGDVERNVHANISVTGGLDALLKIVHHYCQKHNCTFTLRNN